MKDYHNGPVEDERRSCTDLFCFIILILLVVVMLGFGIYAWTSSNFSKLTTPYDPDGKGCGVDHPDHPFVYFASPHVDSLWVTVCVKSCPKEKDKSLDCATNSVIKECKAGSKKNKESFEIYDTEGFQDRICLPTNDHIKAVIADALGSEGMDQKIAALSKSWTIILASIPIAIVLSILFMFIMRFTAGIFVYLLFAIAILGLLLFGIFLIAPSESNYLGIQENRTVSIIIGVVCVVLALLILLAFCCFRKRVKLAAIVVKLSARFVNENCLMLILPLVLFVCMVVFLILWILEALGFYSMGEPKHEPHQLPFQHFQTDKSVIGLLLVHVFQLLWVLFFLVETGDFLVAGAATSWYFQREDPYSESSSRYRNFHIGSVALGSFFLALLGFIKFLYQLLTPESDEEEGCLGSWKKFCSCCCFLCVNYLFNCFNSGAYTIIHLAGDSYCTSAWEAISLKIKEPASSAIVAFMGVLFSILVRVGITAATCAICYLILSNAEPYSIDVPDVTAPMVVIAMIGFTISSFFTSLYSEAMEAIYVCYLADKEAGGGEDKAPAELLEFLEEAKKDNHFVE